MQLLSICSFANNIKAYNLCLIYQFFNLNLNNSSTPSFLYFFKKYLIFLNPIQKNSKNQIHLK